MSMRDWDDLIRSWGGETLTMDQAIGQLLTWGKLVAERLHKLKVKISNLEHRLSDLERHIKK